VFQGKSRVRHHANQSVEGHAGGGRLRLRHRRGHVLRRVDRVGVATGASRVAHVVTRRVEAGGGHRKTSAAGRGGAVRRANRFRRAVHPAGASATAAATDHGRTRSVSACSEGEHAEQVGGCAEERGLEVDVSRVVAGREVDVGGCAEKRGLEVDVGRVMAEHGEDGEDEQQEGTETEGTETETPREEGVHLPVGRRRRCASGGCARHLAGGTSGSNRMRRA
jgi:hypothetical protein